jgi:PAS domain S-box-containing protein
MEQSEDGTKPEQPPQAAPVLPTLAIENTNLSPEDIQRLVQELDTYKAALTEQQHAVQYLQQQVEHTRSHAELYDQAPVAYVVIDEDGFIVEINRVGRAMLGFEHPFPPSQPQRFADFIIPDDRDTYTAHCTQMAATPTQASCEVRLRYPVATTRNGCPPFFHVRLESTIAFHPIHQTREYRTVIIDISESKQSQQALRESEEVYRAMFEKNQAVKLLIDPDTGLIVDANPAACGFYGYSRETLQTMCILDINILPPDQVRAEMEQARLERRSYFLFQHCLASGEVRDVEVHSSPLDIQGRKLLFSIVHDITDRKRAEEAVWSHAQFLETLLDTIPSPVFYEDTFGNYLGCNRLFAEQILGMPRANIIGRSPYTIFEGEDTLHPDIAHIHHEWDRQLLREPGVQVYESQVRCADGMLRDFILFKTTFLNSSGEIAGIVGVMLDITYLKRAEESMRESEARYRRLVETSPDAIIRMNLDGTLTMCNQCAANLLGVPSADDLVGQNVFDFLTPRDRQRARATLHTTLQAGGSRNGRYEVIRLDDGTTIPVETNIAVIQDTMGNPMALIVIARDILKRIRHEREREAIISVAAALRTATNRNELVQALLAQTAILLHAEGVALLLHNTDEQTITVEQGHGRWTFAQGSTLSTSEGLGHLVATTPYLSNDATNDPTLVLSDPMFATTRAVACIPLVTNKQTLGILCVGCPHTIIADDMHLLNAIGNIAANALQRITLHEQTVHRLHQVQMLLQQLEDKNREILQAYDATIEGWARALEMRDNETEGHTQRVTRLTERLVRAMGMNEDDIAHIRRGAILHDIGKIAIPDGILLKPGPLSEEEWDIMRKHPEYAYEMLSHIEYLRPALDIPFCHHERWDGSGYPRGLKSEEIPLAARIFAVADVWDALRSNRPYRVAWTKEAVRAYILERAGIEFDPAIVEVFLQLVERDP